MTAVLLTLAVAYVAVHVARFVLAWRHLRGLPERPAEPTDPVTVLQPILSGDPMLEARLAANLRAAPDARFAWLVDDDDEAGRAIAHGLAARHANVVVLSGRAPRDGENPKLLKLVRAGEDRPGLVADGAVVVLDDDTLLTPGGAGRLAALALGSGGIATAIPVWAERPRNLAEASVAGFVNGQGVSAYFAIAALRRNRTINGMAYAVSVRELRHVGGFAAAGHEVTDDWAVAKLWTAHDLPLRQTVEPAHVQLALHDLRGAARVLRRWMQFAWRYVRANLDPALVVLVVAPGLLALTGFVLALSAGAGASIAWVALLLLRAVVNATLVRRVARVRGGPAGIVMAAVIEPMLPVLALAVAWRPRRVNWRTRVMDLTDGTIRYR